MIGNGDEEKGIKVLKKENRAVSDWTEVKLGRGGTGGFRLEGG